MLADLGTMVEPATALTLTSATGSPLLANEVCTV
jgi:hypothetical protein